MGDELVLASGSLVGWPAVRLAGLPASGLAGLRCVESFGLAGRLAGRRRRSAVEGAALADELYAVIGALADAGPKPGLVGLRRALHRGRLPGAGEWNDAIEAALPPAAAARVRTWISDVRAYREQRSALSALLAREVAERRTALRATAGDARFRRALSQASPALYADLDKWLADASRAPRLRTEIRLAKYVSRAAAKTSPFSTFTISAIADWADGDALAAPAGPLVIEGVSELNGSLLPALHDYVRRYPALAARLRLRLNPSLGRRDGRIFFIGRSPKEPIVALAATAPVELLLRVFAERPSSTLPELTAALVAKTGADSAGVGRFLDGMLDAGLLDARTPVRDQGAEPIGELADWVAAQDSEERDAALPGLVRIHTELSRRVAVSDVAGQLARQDALCGAVGGLSHAVGLAPSPDPVPAKWAFHENAVVAEPAFACGTERWRAALEDLDAIRRVLAPFDPALPVSLALASYCAEKFGAGCTVPVLAVRKAINELRLDSPASEASRTDAEVDLTRLLSSGPWTAFEGLAHARLPKLRQLSAIQEEVRRVLTPSADPRADPAAATDPAVLEALAGGWPEWIPEIGSIAGYVQAATDGPDLCLVVNAVHVGHGRGRSRLSHLARRAGGTGRPTGQAEAGLPIGTTDVVRCEFAGVFGTALNVRDTAVEYEIDYPFTMSSRPASERIALGELTVVHDPSTGLVRLRCERLDREVRPLHLGMMSDVLLPPTARFLAMTFGTGYLIHRRTPLPLVAAEEPASDTVVKSPRVRVGAVVLRRTRWTCPIGLVPRRDRAASDAEHLENVADWLWTHGIPAQCFVRKARRGPAAWRDGEDVAADALFGSSHKPIFIDFASWHLAMVFDRWCEDAEDFVELEEVFPAHEGADLVAGSVAEFIVEVSDRSRR